MITTMMMRRKTYSWVGFALHIFNAFLQYGVALRGEAMTSWIVCCCSNLSSVHDDGCMVVIIPCFYHSYTTILLVLFFVVIIDRERRGKGWGNMRLVGQEGEGDYGFMAFMTEF